MRNFGSHLSEGLWGAIGIALSILKWDGKYRSACWSGEVTPSSLWLAVTGWPRFWKYRTIKIWFILSCHRDCEKFWYSHVWPNLNAKSTRMSWGMRSLVRQCYCPT